MKNFLVPAVIAAITLAVALVAPFDRTTVIAMVAIALFLCGYAAAMAANWIDDNFRL